MPDLESATTLEQRTQAVLAMLAAGNTTTERVDIFDGEPVAKMDADGAAHPYAAVYTSPGFNDPAEQMLDSTAGHLTWTFQVTAAGGDPTRARRAIDRVNARLLGQRLVVDGIGRGVIRSVGDPGPLRTDRSVPPPRTYCPLLFNVDL